MIVLLVLARTLHIGGAMLLVALPFFAGLILRPSPDGSPGEGAAFQALMLKWLWAAWLIEALSGLAWFWLVAEQMCDQPPWARIDSSDLEAVLGQMQFGRLWILRAGLGLALGVILGGASRNRFRLSARSPVTLILLIVSGALLVSLAWAGHAVAGVHDRFLHLGVDVLHLVTGAVWPIGLIPLALYLWHQNRSSSQSLHGGAIETVRRFSRASFRAVLILVVTGTVNGWLMIGSWLALVTTAYGELLLAKVALVGIMIGFGAVNRMKLLPCLSSEPDSFPALRKNVLVESLLAVVVLVIVGMMGMTSPPS
jgi:putative copper resistance protein D